MLLAWKPKEIMFPFCWLSMLFWWTETFYEHPGFQFDSRHAYFPLDKINFLWNRNNYCTVRLDYYHLLWVLSNWTLGFETTTHAALDHSFVLLKEGMSTINNYMRVNTWWNFLKASLRRYFKRQSLTCKQRYISTLIFNSGVE